MQGSDAANLRQGHGTRPEKARTNQGRILTLRTNARDRLEVYYMSRLCATAELIAFPAGGIAAIVIGTVVMVMVVAKVICVITGYERRLPNIDLDCDTDDDQRKQIVYSERQSTDGASSNVVIAPAATDCDDVTPDNAGQCQLAVPVG